MLGMTCNLRDSAICREGLALSCPLDIYKAFRKQEGSSIKDLSLSSCVTWLQ